MIDLSITLRNVVSLSVCKRVMIPGAPAGSILRHVFLLMFFHISSYLGNAPILSPPCKHQKTKCFLIFSGAESAAGGVLQKKRCIKKGALKNFAKFTELC